MRRKQIEDTAGDLIAKLRDTLDSYADDAGSQLRSGAKKAGDRAYAAYDDALSSARAGYERQPVAALLMAAGAGLVIGLVLGRRSA